MDGKNGTPLALELDGHSTERCKIQRRRERSTRHRNPVKRRNMEWPGCPSKSINPNPHRRYCIFQNSG